MEFIRDKTFDNLITMYKGKITNELANIRLNHGASQKLKNSKLDTSDGK